MIRVGLTGWGDHDDLYPPGTAPGEKLNIYASHFPVVEVDSSFYAVQPQKNIEKWLSETPSSFGFVFKAYQGMTGHGRGKMPFSGPEEMFRAFAASVEPVRQAGRLKAVLFQYPPWFDCNRKHVEQLKQTRERIGDLPAALEFRHRSWFRGDMKEKTLRFMEKEGWIHSICDEPEAGEGSVPTVLHATSPLRSIVRLHGRNADGWERTSVKDDEEWRRVRYLYRYSRTELEEWKQHLQRLSRTCKEICVLFNNNSGGDAAHNAKELQALLGQSVPDFPPKQIRLF